MADYKYLFWVDLETTGTDESMDSIIEIGAIVTDLELNQLGEFQHVIAPSALALGRLTSNQFVFDMHKANGLWDLVCVPEQLPVIHDVERYLMDFLLKGNVGSHQAIIAGSGVAHFDRRFIKAQMPVLDRHLAYPCLDVGIIRRAWEMWTGTPPPQTTEGKNHRAMDDVRLHLEEARAFKQLWLDLLPDPEFI